MTITINDKGKDTKMIISRGDKTLLKRKGRSIRSLLKFVFEGTKNINVKKSIMELQPILVFMKDTTTSIEIKEK